MFSDLKLASDDVRKRQWDGYLLCKTQTTLAEES
jgi:hypothetical protein